MNIYIEKVQHLKLAETRNLSGFCSASWAACEDILNLPTLVDLFKLALPANGYPIPMDLITLKPGRSWTVIKCLEDQAGFNEESKGTAYTGPFESEYKFFVNKDDWQTRGAVLMALEAHEGILITTDRNHKRRLMGSKERGVDFSFAQVNKSGSNQFECAFKWLSASRCFYVEDYAAPTLVGWLWDLSALTYPLVDIELYLAGDLIVTGTFATFQDLTEAIEYWFNDQGGYSYLAYAEPGTITTTGGGGGSSYNTFAIIIGDNDPVYFPMFPKYSDGTLDNPLPYDELPPPPEPVQVGWKYVLAGVVFPLTSTGMYMDVTFIPGGTFANIAALAAAINPYLAAPLAVNGTNLEGNMSQNYGTLEIDEAMGVFNLYAPQVLMG